MAATIKKVYYSEQETKEIAFRYHVEWSKRRGLEHQRRAEFEDWWEQNEL